MKYVHYPDRIVMFRSEGWGKTYVGQHGVNAISDISKNGKVKICVWGNSYIEAFQVNDNEKIPQVLTSLLSENDYPNLMAFGVGMSGYSVADYYFNIPRYERVVPSIAVHLIMLTDFNDILPTQARATDVGRGMLLENPYRLESNYDVAPRYQSIKHFLDSCGIYFLWDPIKALITSHIRLAPRLVEDPKPPDPEVITERKRDLWMYLLTELRKQTSLPIVFVYCPSIPVIKNGTISLLDPNEDVKISFGELVKLHNMHFIDISDVFIRYYRENNVFPRGFANSRPGEGHFNPVGHRIVARALYEFIRDNPNVFHSN